MSGARILVVDDDPAILRAVQRGLEGTGFQLRAAASAAAAIAECERFHPDVILLDLILPDGDGIEVCEKVRGADGPAVIVLSAVGDDARKVRALDAGADDYLTKPFSMQELGARIRVALRHQAKKPGEPVLSAGLLRLDLASRSTTIGGAAVHLTPREFELCRYLLLNQGRVLTQRQILTRVWGAEYADDHHILRTFIHQLRTKLEAGYPGAGRLVVNDPGVGYRLEVGEGG